MFRPESAAAACLSEPTTFAGRPSSRGDAFPSLSLLMKEKAVGTALGPLEALEALPKSVSTLPPNSSAHESERAGSTVGAAAWGCLGMHDLLIAASGRQTHLDS